MISCSSFPSHSLIAYSLLILAMKVDSLLDQIPTDNQANGLGLASNLKENLDADPIHDSSWSSSNPSIAGQLSNDAAMQNYGSNLITATGDSVSESNPFDLAVKDVNVQTAPEPYELESFAGAGGNEVIQSMASSQYLAFLDGNDGLTNVLPKFNFPPGLFELFKEAIPQFDLNGVLNWFTQPEPPQCEDGKFAFCCEFGPPERASRDIKNGEETEEAKAIRLGRRKKCNEWRADNPVCHFPENEFCCFCRDRQQGAYECYLSRWRNDPRFQGKPERNPRHFPSKLPKRDLLPIQSVTKTENNNNLELHAAETLPGDPNPVEGGGPYPEAGSWNDLDMNRNPKGMPRLPYTCTEEYLESVGIYMKPYTPPERLIPGVTGPDYKRPGRTPGKKWPMVYPPKPYQGKPRPKPKPKDP